MDKKNKKLIVDEDNVEDFLNFEDEEEINNIIKKAEQEIKDKEERKKRGIVDDDDDDDDEEKPKKKKKKKKKKIVEEEEEEEDEEDDKEEYRKWKEQKKLEKLKKEKEKEKEKKKKQKKKNIDNNSDEDDYDSDEMPKKKKSKKKKKNYESGDDEEEENESDDNNITNKGPEVDPKVYKKIKPNDLKLVLTIMKKCNLKYQEGVNLCKEGNYEESLDYLKHAKSSFLGLNKMIQSNTEAYPKEFRQIMASKINDKIKSIHQAAKDCSRLNKENATKNILNNNNMKSNNNYNYNFNNNSNMNNNNQNNQKSIHDKEEDEMDQKIESEIMVKNPKVKFSDIIGMEEMKQTLYEIIVVPTIRPDLFTGIRKPQRGILLFGPPGTGKTLIAKAIASECNSTFFNISASSLTSKWVGESEKTVKSLFKIAYKKVPSIIFIDEIDSILSKRSESENEATKRLKTEFLIQFDGLGSNANARLLVIAATNRPMDLDEALLRRLPKRVYCGPLDENGRFEFIKKVINRVEVNLSDDDIRDIAKKTNDYSNSDLMELCREAAYQPVRELSMEEIMKVNKFRPLVKQDLLNAVQKIRGTLSKKVRDELQKWNEQFGGV